MIRRADICDVPTLGQIINDAAEYGLMLHRSPSYLYENMRDFHVAVEEKEAGQLIVGVCGLKIVWANLAELYALVIRPDQRGKGLGKQLVATCIHEAEMLGIRQVMALTYERIFFEKLNFRILDREQLPLKVWSECVRCSKNQSCDEIAMVRVLEQVPEIQTLHQPDQPPPNQYIVPTTIENQSLQDRRKMDVTE